MKGEVVSGLHGGSCVMSSLEQFQVRVCGCGVVHLCFGATVIHLTDEAAIEVSEVLAESAAGLKKRARSEDPVNSEEATIDLFGNMIFGRFPLR